MRNQPLTSAAVMLSGLLIFLSACTPGTYTRPDGTTIDPVAVHPAGSIDASDGGFDLYLETEIDAPADRVWEVIGRDFANVGRWASLIESSRPLSPEEVELPPGVHSDPDAPVLGRATPGGIGEPHEILINYDDASMTFTFRAANLPSLIKMSQNTTRVIPLTATTSKVTFDIHAVAGISALERRLHDRFREGLKTVQMDLKHYVEHGEVSPAKKAALGEER